LNLLDHFFLFSDPNYQMAQLEAVEAQVKSDQVQDYKACTSNVDKAKQRRQRITSTLGNLRKVVPGLDSDSMESDVYGQTARYVTFLRRRATQKDVKDFVKGIFLY
jgi:hypothetical protein